MLDKRDLFKKKSQQDEEVAHVSVSQKNSQSSISGCVFGSPMIHSFSSSLISE